MTELCSTRAKQQEGGLGGSEYRLLSPTPLFNHPEAVWEQLHIRLTDIVDVLYSSHAKFQSST